MERLGQKKWILMNNYIPIDKSWAIRCIILDIINGYHDTKYIVKGNVPDDVNYALNAAIDWNFSTTISVGESATLLRFLRFVCWKYRIQKGLIKSGTLINREVCKDANIVNWNLEDLLKLDGGTSQWASIAYLCGNRPLKLPENIPFKLKETIYCYNYWKNCREKNKQWELFPDITISRQMCAFNQLMGRGNTDWKPLHSEDYCFARAFNLINAEEALKRWPQLQNHESNRIEEMEKTLTKFDATGRISSVDHRVIQSMVLYAIFHKKEYVCANPECVKKSWPQFFDFVSSLTNKKNRVI